MFEAIKKGFGTVIGIALGFTLWKAVDDYYDSLKAKPEEKTEEQTEEEIDAE